MRLEPMRVKNSGLSSLRSFNVRIYIAGSSLSYVGLYVQSFATWWLVLSITDSRAALPFTIGLQTVPLLLFGTWGGSIIDRFDNRRLMTLTSAVNMTAAIALGLLVQHGHVAVVTVYGFSLVAGFVSVFERPALQAMISELARPEELPSAVALNAMVFPIARLLGPPIATLIIAVSGLAVCFYVNAGSYFFFLAALTLLRRHEMFPRRQATSRKGMVAAGFRYVRGDPVVGPVLLAMFVVGLAGFNFQMVMPLMAKYTFHLSEGELALPVSLSAVGALAAGVVMAGLKKPTVRIVGIGGVLFGALLIAYGDAPNYVVWAAISFPIGVAATVFTTVVVQILQAASRPEMLGRVLALYNIAFLGTTPIGALFVAWLSTAFTPRAPFVAGGVVVAVTGAVMLLARARRSSEGSAAHPDRALEAGRAS